MYRSKPFVVQAIRCISCPRFSGYDERLPVVLVASTESGARIPSDTFPYCDVADPLALRQVLSDGALANREMPFPPLHTKNSAGVRFFVIALPWLSIRRWELRVSRHRFLRQRYNLMP